MEPIQCVGFDKSTAGHNIISCAGKDGGCWQICSAVWFQLVWLRIYQHLLKSACSMRRVSKLATCGRSALGFGNCIQSIQRFFPPAWRQHFQTGDFSQRGGIRICVM
jgi:hypothetical protein